MSNNDDTDFLSYICGSPDGIGTVAEWTSEFGGGSRSFIFEERLSRANQLVDSGNNHFKSGENIEAQKHYLAAAYQVDFDFEQQFEMTEEHRQQIRSIKIRILLNLCNNLLKLKDVRTVRRCASLGLKLCKINGDEKPENIAKFLYRRGRANLEDNNATDAVEDLREATKIVPTDSNVRELFTIATLAMKKQKFDADNVWKGKMSDPLSEFMAPLEQLPEIDLTITDKAGKAIYRSLSQPAKPATAASAPATNQTRPSVWDVVCCKRKKH